MHRERTTERRQRDGAEAGVYYRERLTTEALHLRSYDHRRGYDLTVEARRLDGERTFERRYYLPPGEAVDEDDLPAGVYELTVTLDNDDSEQLRCRLDAAPGHTAVIEVGNGTLSLTQGLVG